MHPIISYQTASKEYSQELQKERTAPHIPLSLQNRRKQARPVSRSWFVSVFASGEMSMVSSESPSSHTGPVVWSLLLLLLTVHIQETRPYSQLTLGYSSSVSKPTCSAPLFIGLNSWTSKADFPGASRPRALSLSRTPILVRTTFFSSVVFWILVSLSFPQTREFRRSADCLVTDFNQFILTPESLGEGLAISFSEICLGVIWGGVSPIIFGVSPHLVLSLVPFQ